MKQRSRAGRMRNLVLANTFEGTAKVFNNGNSQAVRLPKECRFDDAEVIVKKVGDAVTLLPKRYTYRGLMARLRAIGPAKLAPRNQPRRKDRRDF